MVSIKSTNWSDLNASQTQSELVQIKHVKNAQEKLPESPDGMEATVESQTHVRHIFF